MKKRDMRCCGNCLHGDSYKWQSGRTVLYCMKVNHGEGAFAHPHYVCQRWEFDNTGEYRAKLVRRGVP